ncbi:MAG: helix-turn-helix transcriptional regulator [Actinomycetota bacterium]
MSKGRLGKRLQRILLLLPYAIKHPGISIDELARKFGVGREALTEDLQLVFLCGLPGYGPGDLIDVTFEEDRVYVRMADYFGAPFRLTPAEALALYAGGKALAGLPEMAEADALRTALDKLGRALGMTEAGVEILMEAGAEEHLARLNEALSSGRRVHIEYLSAGRNEMTERDVDPWGLVIALGAWYLVGHDHLRGEERIFRVDRIRSIAVLDEEVAVPDDFDPERYRGAFVGDADQPRMTIEISPAVAAWFSEYYPVESAEELEDGWSRVQLIASGPSWSSTLLLRLGDEVRAVEPPEALGSARALAERIASLYA